jgi:hypothetical protein
VPFLSLTMVAVYIVSLLATKEPDLKPYPAWAGIKSLIHSSIIAMTGPMFNSRPVSA